jgi:hypothetical protein
MIHLYDKVFLQNILEIDGAKTLREINEIKRDKKQNYGSS